MAKPPDGQSSFFHSSDSLQLLDPDGTLWGAISLPLDNTSLSLSFPVEGDRWSSKQVLDVAVQPSRVAWVLHHPLLEAGCAIVDWTVDTPGEALVPIGEFHAPRRFGGHAPDAPLHATISASEGAVVVRDAAGAARVYARLAQATHPLPSGPGMRRALLADGRPVVELYLPTEAGRDVRSVATSLP